MQDRQLRENTARAAEANERAAWAAEELVATQQRMADAQRQESDRRQQQEWMAAFAALPQMIERELPAARGSSTHALLFLAKIDKITRDLQPASWVSLYERSPVETEVIYNQLRKFIVPLIRALTQAKDRLPPSAPPLLRSVAQSLLLKDFAGLRQFQEQKELLDQKYGERKTALESERDRLRRNLEAQSARVGGIQQQLQAMRTDAKRGWLACGVSIAAAVVLFARHEGDDSLGIIGCFVSIFAVVLLRAGIADWTTAKHLKAQLAEGHATLATMESHAPNRIVQIEEQLPQLSHKYQVHLQQLADGKLDPSLADLAGPVS